MPEKSYKRTNSTLSSSDYIRHLLDKGLISVNIHTGEIFKNYGPYSGRLDGYVNEQGYVIVKVTDLKMFWKDRHYV